MIIFRRFLLLAALGFWQGGFAFYAAVVVPIGEQVLSSPIEQGFVTRRVTNYLNLAGAVALSLLFWDLAATRQKSRPRTVSWGVMAVGLCLLAWLHPRLDRFLDAEAMQVLDDDRFYVAHQVYLITSAVQWASGLVFLLTTLRVWRAEDQRMAETEHVEEQA